MNKDCSLIQPIIDRDNGHMRKKAKLGHRVQVLRVLIINYYRNRRYEYNEDDFMKHCEAVLDNTLARFNYNLEAIIDKWREVASEFKDYPSTCKLCEYRPPFCLCSKQTIRLIIDKDVGYDETKTNEGVLGRI